MSSGFIDSEGVMVEKKKHMLTVLKDESSIRDKFSNVRGFVTINQTEG